MVCSRNCVQGRSQKYTCVGTEKPHMLRKVSFGGAAVLDGEYGTPVTLKAVR
jgi:hypothetical protein